MDLKKLAQNEELTLKINGKTGWRFKDAIRFKDHATNYSSMTFHHVIHKDVLSGAMHFENHTYLNDLENFTVVELLAAKSRETLFTGIMTNIGRFSLDPNKVKDKSIIAADVRIWLSKKSPADIQFKNIHPQQALLNFVKALNEPKITLGKVSFTSTENILAYDTTNKSPYSILKDVIARQTKSFLYFSSNNDGQIVINFASEQDLKNVPPVEISPNTWQDYAIVDIKVDKSASAYFNRFRIESEHVVYNVLSQESFELSNIISSIFLNGKFGKLDPNQKSFYYQSTNSNIKQNLLLVSKEVATSGKDYQAYYSKGTNEIVFNPEWDRSGLIFVVYYYKKGRYSVTLENSQEINNINALSGFKGDVYRYDKYNDYSSGADLIRFGQHELDFNSKLITDIKITSTKAFLNVGDVVNFDYGLPKIDGRYYCIGLEGEFIGSNNSLEITYHLRNGLNADTYLNYYDGQSFRDKPLDLDDAIIYRTLDKFRTGNWHNIPDEIKDTAYIVLLKNLGYLPAELPYSHNKYFDWKEFKLTENFKIRTKKVKYDKFKNKKSWETIPTSKLK